MLKHESNWNHDISKWELRGQVEFFQLVSEHFSDVVKFGMTSKDLLFLVLQFNIIMMSERIYANDLQSGIALVTFHSGFFAIKTKFYREKPAEHKTGLLKVCKLEFSFSHRSIEWRQGRKIDWITSFRRQRMNFHYISKCIETRFMARKRYLPGKS